MTNTRLDDDIFLKDEVQSRAMILIFLVLLVAIGFGAYWFFRRRGGGTLFESESKKEKPLEIARRRYASGEISRHEFEQIKRDLEDKEK